MIIFESNKTHVTWKIRPSEMSGERWMIIFLKSVFSFAMCRSTEAGLLLPSTGLWCEIKYRTRNSPKKDERIENGWWGKIILFITQESPRGEEFPQPATEPYVSWAGEFLITALTYNKLNDPANEKGHPSRPWFFQPQQVWIHLYSYSLLVKLKIEESSIMSFFRCGFVVRRALVTSCKLQASDLPSLNIVFLIQKIAIIFTS